MRIVVYPHDMAIGGSQINAIELAGAAAKLGHEVMVLGVIGPLSELVADLGLEQIVMTPPGRRPSPRVGRTLTQLVRTRGVDVLHTYEWPPTLEAAYGPRLRLGTAVVSSVMSMGVAPFLPHDVPLIVGTKAIQGDCLARGRRVVHLLEPPVDTERNGPGAVPPEVQQRFDATWRLREDDFVVVVVSRLVPEMKREGILAAIDAMALLAALQPIRLLVVGGGPALQEVAARAASVNASAGREVITVTGELADPRPAYARADVVLGMGSSALRGMAFEKPLIVQGERGFWQLLTPESLPTFLHQGWYGVGRGEAGSAVLARLLSELVDQTARRADLGQLSRHVVESQFGLTRAAQHLVRWYEEALGARPAVGTRVTGLVQTTTGLARYKAHRRYQRLRGTASVDDFNAVSAQPNPSAEGVLTP